jgi:hypothetical protein
MVDDRRKGKNGSDQNGHRNGEERRDVVPLRVVEEIVSYDTLSAIQHLESLAKSGDCLGIAFGAILRGGQVAHGVTGAAIEQPIVTAGLLAKVIVNTYSNPEEGW